MNAKERNREDIFDHLIQWPMKNDSCMQSRMGMGVTENMEVVDGTYKELMSVSVIRHVLALNSSREGRWWPHGIGPGELGMGGILHVG